MMFNKHGSPFIFSGNRTVLFSIRIGVVNCSCTIGEVKHLWCCAWPQAHNRGSSL